MPEFPLDGFDKNHELCQFYLDMTGAEIDNAAASEDGAVRQFSSIRCFFLTLGDHLSQNATCPFA